MISYRAVLFKVWKISIVMFVPIVLSIVLFLVIYIYLNSLRHERYWKKRGVVFSDEYRYMTPFWEFMTTNRSLFKILQDIYDKYPKEPAVGIGALFAPTLFIRDAQNIQHVMQNDFSSFNHRGVEVTSDDKLADNVLFTNGARWKVLRQSMSPLFTANKLKSMFNILDKSAKDFVSYMKDNQQLWTTDAFDTLSTFCSAAVGAAVFGITTKSIFDSPFLEMAKKSIKPTFVFNLKFTVIFLSYKLGKLLNIKIFNKYEDFFITAIQNVMQQRKVDKSVRNDFIDHCIALQKNEMLRDSSSGYEIKPTTDVLAAQGFFFYLAGVEPCATAMYGTLTELGRHPEILQRVHDEIDKTFEKHNGQLTHDVVQDMEYLEKVLSEGMRMYPPIGFLFRECVHDSVLPVGNIKVGKGTKIFTPIYAIHHDEKYYPDAKVFNPDRFTKDGLQTTLSDSIYMPFGKGNRLCIGVRFARLQVKAGLVYLLRHFAVETIIGPGGIKFKKEQLQLRLTNLKVFFKPRNMKG